MATDKSDKGKTKSEKILIFIVVFIWIYREVIVKRILVFSLAIRASIRSDETLKPLNHGGTEARRKPFEENRLLKAWKFSREKKGFIFHRGLYPM